MESKKTKSQAHRYREQIGGWLPETRGGEVGKMCKGSQKKQISNYKSWGYSVQLGNYS